MTFEQGNCRMTSEAPPEPFVDLVERQMGATTHPP